MNRLAGTMPVRFLGAVLVAALGTPSAHALSITASDRFVSLERLPGTTTRIDATDPVDFDASIPSPPIGVSQTSQIGSERIFAETRHDLSPALEEQLDGESFFRVTFELLTPTPFVLHFDAERISIIGNGGAWLPITYHVELEAVFSGPSGEILAYDFDGIDDCPIGLVECALGGAHREASGELDAGVYTLMARSRVLASSGTLCSPSLPGCVDLVSESDGVMAVELQLVPEPGSALLLASGIGLLAGLRRGSRAISPNR